MRRWGRRLARSERGATAIEYGLIIGLIAMGLFVALGSVMNRTGGMYEKTGNKLGG